MRSHRLSEEELSSLLTCLDLKGYTYHICPCFPHTVCVCSGKKAEKKKKDFKIEVGLKPFWPPRWSQMKNYKTRH